MLTVRLTKPRAHRLANGSRRWRTQASRLSSGFRPRYLNLADETSIVQSAACMIGPTMVHPRAGGAVLPIASGRAEIVSTRQRFCGDSRIHRGVTCTKAELNDRPRKISKFPADLVVDS